MKAEKNKVVTFHYHLTDETGTKVDSSHDRAEPLTILFGHGQIIPGLEQAMEGHEAGDKFDVSVPPEHGYGERREDFTQRVPKKYFRDADHLKSGDATVLSVQGGGYRQVVVLKVGSSVIDVDLNHPMAGKTLKFDVEVTDVRDATPEEVEHGHVHGEGGHHH
ncbi:peptidylprolyl isomerase [Rudaea sp.]|uniref:peptidylprolyl isomerase n=1 Tax=Rudaea sp. TaxID=2136325 RepID=UPI0037839104